MKRQWSFSGLATIVRIVLMYYLNLEKLAATQVIISISEADLPGGANHKSTSPTLCCGFR